MTQSRPAGRLQQQENGGFEMKRMVLSAVLGLALLGARAPVVLAQMGHCAFRGEPPPLGMMLKGLNLTEAQRTQVKAIMKSHHQAIEPLREQLHNEHQQFATRLLTPGQVTVSDLTPIQQQTAQTEQQMRQEMLKAVVEVRAILTPEQLAKAGKIHQKMEQMHAEMRSLMEPDGGAPSDVPTPPDAPPPPDAQE